MPNIFHAYLLDADGKISRAPVVLESSSDAQAIELAQQLVDGQDVEVWQGTRMITVLKHRPEDNSPE